MEFIGSRLTVAFLTFMIGVVTFYMTVFAVRTAHDIWLSAPYHLHFAAGSGDLETVKALIAKGASVGAKDNLGETALIIATDERHMNVVNYLISVGADVNQKDDEMEATALLHAASSGYVPAIRILLAAGADPTVKDRVNQTALLRAVQGGHQEAARLLVKAESDCHLKTCL